MRFIYLASVLAVAIVVWQQNLFVSTPAMLQFLGLETNTIPEPIWFVGDVFLGRDVARRMEQSGVDYPFAGNVFDDQPFIVANFESAAPDTYESTANFTFRFNVRQAYLRLLKHNGYEVLSLANNHSFDAGMSGYEESVAAMRQVGIVPVGPLPVSPYTIIERNDVTIAILAVDLVTTTYDPTILLPLTTAAAAESDVAVVYVHWGNEYELTHNLFQEQVASDVARAGADVIIGHHPHVVQDIAYIDDTLVFYSLGNFIFDQYFSVDTQQGLVLELVPEHDRLEWTLVPVSSAGTYIQPNRLVDEQVDAFLSGLATRSDKAVQDQVGMGNITQLLP